MEEIILLGIGGHSHSVVDSIEKAGKYHILGFLDTIEKQNYSYKHYSVIGTDDDLESYYLSGIQNAFITIGYMGSGTIRNRLYRRLKKIGFNIPNIIDISASIASDAVLEDGIFIGKKAVVNANATICAMCIINTGTIIEHDCHVGEYSHLAAGSVLCGGVTIGRQTLVGANATVIQEIKVGSNAIIGAGTVIVKNLQDNFIRYGNIEKLRDIKG